MIPEVFQEFPVLFSCELKGTDSRLQQGWFISYWVVFFVNKKCKWPIKIISVISISSVWNKSVVFVVHDSCCLKWVIYPFKHNLQKSSMHWKNHLEKHVLKRPSVSTGGLYNCHYVHYVVAPKPRWHTGMPWTSVFISQRLPFDSAICHSFDLVANPNLVFEIRLYNNSFFGEKLWPRGLFKLSPQKLTEHYLIESHF